MEYDGCMASLHIRIDAKLKQKVQRILQQMGLDMSSAVTMYLQHIVLNEELPFTPSAHPEEPVRPLSPAIEKQWMEWEEKAMREGKIFNSAEDLFTSWKAFAQS